jgi:hypothetical protein
MEKDQEHKVPSKETKVEKGKPLLMESELYQEVQKSDRMALVLHMLVLGGIMHWMAMRLAVQVRSVEKKWLEGKFTQKDK